MEVVWGAAANSESLCVFRFSSAERTAAEVRSQSPSSQRSSAVLLQFFRRARAGYFPRSNSCARKSRRRADWHGDGNRIYRGQSGRFRKTLCCVLVRELKFLSPALSTRRLEYKYAAHSASSGGDSRHSANFCGDDFLTDTCIGRAYLCLSEFRIHVHHSCSGYASRFETAADLASASL